jgi:hypothetical protein
MCVLLCANPNVHTWLDAVIARSQRQALPLRALCPADPYESGDATAAQHDGAEANELASLRQRTPAARDQWVLICRLPESVPVSAYERHKPLDALANAWSRLLFLVGWRR